MLLIAAFGMRCLNNDEPSLIWLLIRSALCVAISQRIWQFHLNTFSVVIWRSRLRASSFTARSHRKLIGRLFAKETSSVCINVVSSLNRKERCVSLLFRHYD